ncbi:MULTISPECIES: Atxe2 family lasso peptide isopeptidase [unclassified Novosphingobium]|uniref:Atxe2 family lasso peptide isopeptidase n=1 Tax=unclassified Novosphingobium TaxID=2644732 RepID=UPI00146BCCAD|nr:MULTISPECIES: Atxe2 family lasso peptide isopeptidase [unclassified Novosphingobium]NMN88791.1 dipeptidyl aminopeptidase/acylaminoacyl peptidase [Novosphingobium sp. SG916]
MANSAASSTLIVSNPKPSLKAIDLARLTDLGPSSPGSGEHIIALSPDRRSAAVQIRTADPSGNRYQIQIVVVDLTSAAPPRTVDDGGDISLQFVDGIGGRTVSTGYPAATPLIWSSDGKWLYFLKTLGTISQVWRASVRGGHSEALTHEPEGVGDVLLSSDGRQLIYSSRRRDPSLAAAFQSESLQGFRYDSRFIPLFDNGPQQRVTDTVTRAIDLPNGTARDATPLEAASLARNSKVGRRRPEATSGTGEIAFVIDASPQQATSEDRVAIRRAGGSVQVCSSPECSGALSLWWTSDSSRIRFIRRYGWGDGEMAIFEWRPGAERATRLYVTSDLLIDCQPVDEQLVCARERSADPRHIIILDPKSGRTKVVYDPNPEFHRLALGRIERLNWRNEFGIETFGDLIYPVGYVRGRTYPLIVVQYISRGFLRGGVGDEFPIQAFANRGYAVLSVQRPVTRLRPGSNDDSIALGKSDLKLMDRRNVLSSIETAVWDLVQRGIADPRKIGITGLSDGSSTVQFALINSSMFKAASVSGCCWDPYQDALVGPGAAEAYHESGWPTLIDYDSDFWSHMSLVGNARSIAAPLLIQQSDDEFRGALPSYMALKQAKHPVALYVFPNEHHVKWQPAHRLAAYERNLRWFDYWLKGIGNGREWKSDN